MRSIFESENIGWTYWSYNETFSVMTKDRTTFGPANEQTPDKEILRVLLPDKYNLQKDKKMNLWQNIEQQLDSLILRNAELHLAAIYKNEVDRICLLRLVILLIFIFIRFTDTMRMVIHQVRRHFWQVASPRSCRNY